MLLYISTQQEGKQNSAEWSSLVARRAHNPKVVGSNPASATTKPVNQWLAGFFVRAYKMFLVDVDFYNVFDLRYRP